MMPQASGGLDLIIADTGVGISAHDMAKVLEPFGQANNAIKGAASGTGLGLPLAKAFAELHDATLSLASAPGVGTTVTVSFPAARVVGTGIPDNAVGATVKAG